MSTLGDILSEVSYRHCLILTSRGSMYIEKQKNACPLYMLYDVHSFHNRFGLTTDCGHTVVYCA